jgi:hypothetical protein
MRFANREREVEEILYPMLIARDRPSLKVMIEKASAFISSVAAPQNDDEIEYLDCAADGVFKPASLFQDYPKVLEAAIHDPAALWKMKNIQKMIGR